MDLGDVVFIFLNSTFSSKSFIGMHMKFIPNDDNFVLLAAEGNYKILKLFVSTFLSTQTDLINCILSSKTPFVFPITR